MVAGDHHGADMRPLGGDDRFSCFGARRIDHADQAEQHEVVLHALGKIDLDIALGGRLRVDAERLGWHGAGGDGQRAQRLLGEPFVALQEVGASFFRERDGLAVLPKEAALRQQHLRRALDEDAQVVGIFAVDMDRGVTLALGRERDFGDARKPLQLGGVDAELARGDDQRAFGRVALHHPPALALHQRRVVGERCGPQQFRDGVAVRRALVDRLALDREVALGDVAAAADVDQRVGGGDGAHRHLVAGQRAGLVRADHGGGAEGFDRRQLADDGVGRRHPPHAEAQAHGDDGGQRLGDRGDGERHREQEQPEHDVERERGGAEQAGREHHGADSEHDDAEPLAGAVEFLLQRRRLLLGRLQQACDAADFGRHAGGDHHGAAAAVGGDRAGEQHVAAVAEADVAFDRLELLRHRHALAGQRRLVGLKVRHLDEAGIRRNLVAGFDQHDVAGDDVMGRDALPIAVANDRGLRRGQRHQRADRFLRARLLDEPEHRVEDDDRHDDDRFVGQRALARVLQHPFDHRNHNGDQQDDHQEIFELLQQPFPPRRFRRALQPVRAVLLQAIVRFGLAQAARGVAPEQGQHRRRRHAMRGACAGRFVVLGNRGLFVARRFDGGFLMQVHDAILVVNSKRAVGRRRSAGGPWCERRDGHWSRCGASKIRTS